MTRKLGVLGGAPAFDTPLHVGAPNIGNRARFLDRVADLLDRRWLTNDGKYVRAFEQEIGTLTGARHVVATCNATLALQLTARAAHLTGDVILPSFTFVATAHALSWIGLRPIFCDIDPATHNLDPARVEACLTPETTGIVGVHVWGRTCDTDALDAIARRHGLALIFDAAQALGSSRGGVRVGNFGRAEVVSFHATKMIHSFEGGAVLTNDEELARRVRQLRNFGFTGFDRVGGEGINAKMTEIAAAMGLTNLEDRERFVDVNRAHHDAYREALRGVPGVSVAAYDPAGTPAYQYVVLEIDEARTGLGRDLLWRVLWAENVRARRYFYPGCHRHPPYRTDARRAHETLAATEQLAGRVLLLPTGTAVSPEAIARITEIIASVVGDPEPLRTRLVAQQGS